MTTKHIPFDLGRALAGDALVTQNGTPVTNFRCADPHDDPYPYQATIHPLNYEPINCWFTKEGYFHAGARWPSPNDLFMAETGPRYMVSVDGRTAPRIVHDDKASAVTEAERLMNAGAGDVIRVLRVERTLRRKVTTEWSDE